MFKVKCHFVCSWMAAFGLLFQVASSAPSQTAPPLSSAGASLSHSVPERILIGPGDLLDLTISDVPEMAQSVRLREPGHAHINLVGRLHLAGLTTGEAQKLLEQKLSDTNLLRNPSVSITIREYGTQGVSVLGEVIKPGVYPILGPRTLVDVIAAAGGVTPNAGAVATIKRRDSGKLVTASLSNQGSEMFAGDVEIQPGDQVMISKAGIVYVLGDVGRPGGFVMQVAGRMTLLQAIALAGGANRSAALSKSRILRRTDHGIEETRFDLKRVLANKSADQPVQANDIVYIPSSGAKAFLQRISADSLTQSATSAAVYQSVP